MKKKNLEKKGYTLVEVSIVIALIGIMSSLVVVNLQPGRSQEQVKSAQAEVAAAVKLAQSFALQGRKQGTGVPKCYGVDRTGASSYRIYQSQDDNCGVPHELVEECTLSGGVSVTNFDFGFDVPHGNVVLGGAGTVELSKGSPSFKRHVTLSSSGAIIKD